MYSKLVESVKKVYFFIPDVITNVSHYTRHLGYAKREDTKVHSPSHQTDLTYPALRHTHVDCVLIMMLESCLEKKNDMSSHQIWNGTNHRRSFKTLVQIDRDAGTCFSYLLVLRIMHAAPHSTASYIYYSLNPWGR
ncbi:hypothetical protein Plhal304r1_c023g0080521 [Plasmopara halstedii]